MGDTRMVVCLALVVVVAGSAAAQDRADDSTSRGLAAEPETIDAPTFDWSGRIPVGATLRIADVEGDVTVSPSTSGEARVHGERTHVRSGGRALVFKLVRSGNDVTVCAYYRQGTCDPRGEHSSHHFVFVGQSPSADFQVELPAGVKLATRTGDGRVEVRGARSDVLAESGDGAIHILGASGEVQVHSGDGELRIEDVKGAVRARTGDGRIVIAGASGRVEANSGDGSIEVHLTPQGATGSTTLHTGDGTVSLYLPAAFSGEVEASTGDGSLDSDFPLQVSGRMDSRHVHATLGSGGSGRVDISTSNGDIHLRKE